MGKSDQPVGNATKILFLSHTAEGGSFKVGSHHLAREMSRLGFRVAHVSSPVSILHILSRKGDARKRRLALQPGKCDVHGTFHSVPLVALPIQLHGSRQSLRRHLKRIGFWDADYILIDQPLMADVLELRPPGIAIYRPTDEVFGRAAIARQSSALKRVDGVVATSVVVLGALDLRPGVPGYVIENGVEFAHFAAESDPIARSGFVYAGAMDQRFDWDVVVRIAESFPTEAVRLIGPIAVHPPQLPPNVELVGPLLYAQLGEELRRAKIGLLPFNDALENAGRSPMKFFEYLAAELHVVAKAIPALSKLDAPGAFLYVDGDQSIQAADDALHQKGPNVRGRVVAEGQDWRHKALQLAKFLETTTPQSSNPHRRDKPPWNVQVP